jgi:hypothetical protein
LDLIQGRPYTLNIKTYDGRTYSSDTIQVLRSPDIDSLSWTEDSVGVSIHAYTHDPSNQTNYYRWEYVETWRYNTGIPSLIYWDGSQVLTRPLDDQIYDCWNSNRSTSLILATTQNLTTDTINHQLICEVPSGSEKMSVGYSILIYQYALTKDAYEYWMNLKTNTELTGSLFDPMPSQVSGNLHSVSNPNESVLGFIGASTVSSKRIFIFNRDLATWSYRPYYIDCLQPNSTRANVSVNDPARISKLYDYLLKPGHLYTLIDFPNSAVYIMAQNYCADCRYHGGTNQKPAFWP